MGKKYFLLGIIVFHSVFTYAQNYDLDLRWKVIDTPVIFPDNFTDWIKRNIGEKYSGYNNVTNKPFGQIIQTDQSKHFIDFNKDGKKDIVLELKFRGYMSDSVLEARQQFYKGIFIAQPNGKYLLDTNFIITGRGYENGGEFGDFDGDGNLDYINIIANYHGKQEWKPLDLYKYGNNLSPSIVNMNNGKSFVQTELDVNPEFFSSSGVLVSDIDNDTNDEIILSVSEKFVIYKYNKSNKSFERKVLNLNNKLTQSYGRYITWISEPMIDKTHFISIISYNNNTSGIGVSDLAVIKVDLNQDNYEVLNILKQPSYTWPDGQFSVAGFHTGPFYKYYDLDKDGKDEFIMIGAPGRELNGSQFYAERMGINVFKNNDNVTANFYNIDTLDNLPKGYFGKLNNSIVVYPWSNGLNDVIKVDTATFNKYSFVYYRFDNGKFIRKKMIFDVKHNPLPYMDTWNLADDFNNDGLTDLFITHPDDLRNNKLLIPVYCNLQKPSFNTNKFYFVKGDSLNLTISNVNKGDSLKWYYGSKSDLSNVTNKTFTDSTKLYVTRIDSLGCIISSDTVTITAYPNLQTTIKLNITNFNLTNKIPNNLTNPKTLGSRLMEGGVTSLIKYNIKNVEHLVVIPSDTIPGPQLHFIKKQKEWEFENYYTSFKMDGARSYSIMDTIGNFVYSSHGNESVHPWPLGDIVVVNTISDTLRWKKISTLKGHYDNCSSGDLNNDGLIDVITMNMGLKLDTLITKNPWGGISSMIPYTQNSDGTFTENQDLISDPVLDGKWPGNHSSGAVLIAKILGNSRPEIILADYGMNPSYPSDRYSFAIFKFNESISKYQFLKTPTSLGAFSNYSQGATSMKAGDFNNDGKIDIAIATEGGLDNGKPGGIVQIWLNNDNGNFTPSQSIICDADSVGFREFEVADINKDGWLDIVLNGGGGVAYRGSPPYPKGFYINLEPSIWLNIYGTLVPFQGSLQINRSLNSANIAPQISPVKPFFINGKLTFVGFQSNCTLNGCNVDTTNSFNLYEATVTFCNNLIKPTFNTSIYSFCSSDSLKLTVSNINKGDSLKWYYGTKSDLTNVSNKTFTDSTKLFVTRTDSVGCVISSDTITITKNVLPALPTVKDTVFCQNINASTLLATGATGNTITWYGTNATGGSGSANAVVASTSDTTTKAYYVSQINNTTSCESPRAKITVKINPAPASPSVKDTTYCNNISADTLRATSLTGHSLNWYGTSATGGTASALGSKPITTTVGSFSYYVSQKNNTTGCEGARAKIGVTINPLPIAPIVRDTNYCNNASADTIRINPNTGATLLWYGTNATGGTSSTIPIKPSTASVGAANYYISQIITATGCEGPRSKVVVTIKPIPGAPTLSRDTANFLLSGAAGTTWYKDGSAITDTAQKYKPTTAGSYTAKTTTNGCTSVMSAAYYYLVTDIINLSKDEFIKLAPNPFVNQLNFDFIVKGYQKLNIEVYDVATGSKVANQQNITAGTKIQLGQLARGTYIIRVTSNDNKIAQQFKMVKL